MPGDIPGEYVSRLIKAIVGFEIVVEVVVKLSQNHNVEDQRLIIKKLKESGLEFGDVAGRWRRGCKSVELYLGGILLFDFVTCIFIVCRTPGR